MVALWAAPSSAHVLEHPSALALGHPRPRGAHPPEAKTRVGGISLRWAKRIRVIERASLRLHCGICELGLRSASGGFITNDAQGSVSDITALSGSVVSAEQYDAWGQYRNGTAPTASQPKLSYTGHQFDVETGLVYARARYYDPQLGIFLSQDPVEYGPKDAPWLHLYCYARDNPLRYLDVDGLETAEETQLKLAQQYYAKQANFSGAYKTTSLDELKSAVASFQVQKDQAKETLAYESAMSGGTEMEHVVHDVSDLTGGNDIAMAVTGETITAKGMSPWERVKAGVRGVAQAGQVATGVTGIVKEAGAAALESLAPEVGEGIDEGLASFAKEMNGGSVPKGEKTLFEEFGYDPNQKLSEDVLNTPSDPESGRSYITYAFKDENGVSYVGRASGPGTPQEVLEARIVKGHEHYEPGLTKEVIDVQGSKLASQGAEEFFKMGHEELGAQLTNKDEALSFDRPERAASSLEKIEAFVDEWHQKNGGN